MDVSTPVGSMPAIGTIYQRRLAKLTISTVEDLLFHFPFRYDDFSLISKIANLQAGETITVQGKITSIKNEFTRGRSRFIQKAVLEDETGSIEVVWFNQTYLTQLLTPGTNVSLSGKVDIFKKKLTLISPAYEMLSATNPQTIHTGRLVPIYPETYGVSSKWLRTKIHQLLSLCKDNLIEYLPWAIIAKNNLVPFDWAIQKIHFPDNLDEAEKAQRRLAFDEFFLMQVKNNLRKREWEQKRASLPLAIATYRKEITTFWERLPFELTNAQKQAVKEIFQDLAQAKPMNRLLEGDVGSGKTVVAAIGMYITFLNGFQSVLMAPTEILANQHFDTISKLLSPLGVRVGLVTGSKKLAGGSTRHVDKKKSLRATSHNLQAFDILIGTHALLSESVKLDKLVLIFIDEQHRFGVEQRGLLLKKNTSGITPHVLTMTATPIPRTVALTLYGNLDLSYLNEMPKGRIRVKTWVVEREKRERAYAWVKEKIEKEKAQVFIVCPFIEESETNLTVKAAIKEYEHVRKNIFKEYNVGLLHGKMKAKEKESTIQGFRDHNVDILVATPVVEVGIDIPGATIIIIEGSEHFGLATLHQLRGRVGRRGIQSYCLLFADTESRNSFARLKTLERIHVGARLAELDLALRGPGELHGTHQHGVPALKIASFSDVSLIDQTGKEAQAFLKKDPAFKTAPLLKEKLKTYTIRTIEPN